MDNEPQQDTALEQYKKVAGYLFEATSAKTTMYLCMGIIGLQLIMLVVVFIKK